MNDDWSHKHGDVAGWVVRVVQATPHKDVRNLASELGVTTRSILDAQALIARQEGGRGAIESKNPAAIPRRSNISPTASFGFSPRD
jgi:hypothetical protein